MSGSNPLDLDYLFRKLKLAEENRFVNTKNPSTKFEPTKFTDENARKVSNLKSSFAIQPHRSPPTQSQSQSQFETKLKTQTQEETQLQLKPNTQILTHDQNPSQETPSKNFLPETGSIQSLTCIAFNGSEEEKKEKKENDREEWNSPITALYGIRLRKPYTLFSYQLDIIKWIEEREATRHEGISGGLLNVFMGAGKGIITLSRIVSDIVFKS